MSTNHVGNKGKPTAGVYGWGLRLGSTAGVYGWGLRLGSTAGVYGWGLRLGGMEPDVKTD